MSEANLCAAIDRAFITLAEQTDEMMPAIQQELFEAITPRIRTNSTRDVC